MTIEQYNKRLAELNKQHILNQKKLKMYFARENDPYKEGDIIQDHLHTGRIKGKKYYLGTSYSLPCMVYICDNLTKKETINKKKPEITIFQTNIRK